MNISIMASPSSISKRRKDVDEFDCSIPEELEFSNTLGIADPNANWKPEPNFNLKMSSPRNPRPAGETSKLLGGNKKDDGNKGSVKRGVISPAERQKSKIPALSCEPVAEVTVNTREEQRLRSPNIKHSSSLSPKMHTHGNMGATPKPYRMEKSTGSPRTAERVKTESEKPHRQRLNLKMESDRKEGGQKHNSINSQSPQTLDLPLRPNVHNQKGDTSAVSPKLATRIPVLSSQKAGHDSKAHGSDVSCMAQNSQNQKTESAPLSTKTTEQSFSPKPSMPIKTTGSKENVEGKHSSAASGFKTIIKSSSKATVISKDSLDSKGHPEFRSQVGSGDILDFKSSTTFKSSLDSKDSLDFKTGSSFKVSPSSVTRGSPDFTTPTETKTNSSQDSETSAGSKIGRGYKEKQDLPYFPHSKVNFSLQTDPYVKPHSDLNVSSSSDVSSSSKKKPTQSTSKPTHQDSCSVIEVSRSDCPSAISSGSLNTTGLSTKSSPVPKIGSDTSRSGPPRPSSKSARADLSSSPKLVSASKSHGSSPRRSTATCSPGAGEDQRSQDSVPGVISGLMAPLATSSPKTRTTITSKMKEGSEPEPAASAAMGANPSSTSHKSGLMRGLTFDSRTKTSAKTGAADDKEPLNVPGSKMRAAGGPVSFQGAENDNTGWSPASSQRISGTMLSMGGHLGNENTTAQSNIQSSRQTSAQSRKAKEKQEYTKDNDGAASSLPLIRPLLSPSNHTPTSKRVQETATMTDPFKRPHAVAEEQREVGVQVEVDVVERSASTSPSLHLEAPTSSLIGSSSCQSGSLTSPTVSQPALKHVCRIDIELCSQTLLPSALTGKANSLPTSLRTYSFQQNPSLLSQLRQNQDGGISAESIWEDERECETKRGHNEEEYEEMDETEKPQEVAWDEQGMTWEVYGASVDLESLGTAIQSHLESKIREQENRIRTLRKSICSESSLRGYRMNKRERGRGILGCCGKESPEAD